MFRHFLFPILVFLPIGLHAQSTTQVVEQAQISLTEAVLLGKSGPLRDLLPKPPTSGIKKDVLKQMKQVPSNFKGRKPGGNAVHPDREHQGPDPLRQTGFAERMDGDTVTPIVNVPGLGNAGSPHDPSGDVSRDFFVQVVNVTDIGIFDLKGNLLHQFAMNTLWAEFGAQSGGDPVVLYDERAEKWFITEFTFPANLLIAMSESSDPLGSYYAWSFATPAFPDYPKYGITPNALVITTNESTASNLHQYFLDLEALHAGASSVKTIRWAIPGNTNTEGGFYVTTPVDFNGLAPHLDSRPITLRINDSSWPGGPAQDQIELFTFHIDFQQPQYSFVEKTSIITTPFDPYPCIYENEVYACVPQPGFIGLDAIPQIIMNIPHLRRIGDHESLVFNFVTDVTDGENLAGIRWVELRRTSGSGWVLHQEGTFAPDDGLHRYMGSIAVDERGHIALAYNVSNENTHAGIRFTGRLASDPPGVMTFPEQIIVDGKSEINSLGRFGDYSHMSVSPNGTNTFWYTAEYATENDAGTRIAAFKLVRDSFDLQAGNIDGPVSSHTLGSSEPVTARCVNRGSAPVSGFTITLLLNQVVMESMLISDTLAPDSILTHTFTTHLDLSVPGDYQVGIHVHHPMDENRYNDTLSIWVRKLVDRNGALEVSLPLWSCEQNEVALLTLRNTGGEAIQMALIAMEANGVPADTFLFAGLLPTGQSASINTPLPALPETGIHSFRFALLEINGHPVLPDSGHIAMATHHRLRQGEYVTLVFTTDHFPEENNWEIAFAGSGEVLASGGLYPQASTTYKEKICLPADSCFILRVFDSFSDGMCCTFGEGKFSMLDSAGNILIAHTGWFGGLAEESFCPGGKCDLLVVTAIQHASGPDQSDGSVLFSVSNGVAPYMYSLDGGLHFQNSPLFENLLPGDYDVVITTQQATCLFTGTLSVQFTSAIDTAGMAPALLCYPNPTRDLVWVEIRGWPDGPGQAEVELIDSQGRLIQQRMIGRFDGTYSGVFSLMAYPAGTYYLRIRSLATHLLHRIISL